MVAVVTKYLLIFLIQVQPLIISENESFYVEYKVIQQQSGSVEIQGKVFEKSDKSPIQSINLELEGYPIGTVTGKDGSFTIESPVSEGRIKVFFVGYKTLLIRFKLSK